MTGEISLQCQTGVELDGKSFPASIKFLEADTQSPRHSISFFAPNTWDSNLIFTLPSSDGSDGQVLKTNGSGVLSFVNQTTDTNTQLSAEEVQDIVGAMFTGNTETRIAATYEDSDGTIDLVVDDMTGTEVANDSSPQLVGALDVNGQIITSASNGNITIDPDGTGSIILKSDDIQFQTASAAVAGGDLRLYESSLLTPQNFIAIQAPASVTADTTLTLPDGAGSSGQALSTNGSGTLSWTTVLLPANPQVTGSVDITSLTELLLLK